MIPKKLHYCWFGSKSKPNHFKECYISWEKYCPDFEIIEWNDNNTKDIQSPFFKNALRKKEYAFAADYIRTKILYEQGGVYVDTDFLIVKPIDFLLQYDFFTGEEIPGRVAYGFYGTKPQNHFLRDMLYFYDTNCFNSFAPPVITHTFSDLLKHDNLQINEKIFSPDFFYPLPYEVRNKDYTEFLTENTIAVHLWDHSWKINKENETIQSLLIKIKIVLADFFWYRYPYSYFKRYMREYSRKIYHKILN
ncbi:MAG: glycosyltransferase [Flavobacterium sp.]